MKLSVRLTVTQARLLLLAANVLLALGIPASAAYSYYLNIQGEVDDKDFYEPDLEKFKPTDVPIAPMDNPGRKMLSVADWLAPKPPKPIAEGDKPVVPVTSTKIVLVEGVLPVGPLEEEWSYTSYIIRENPLNNLVVLSKKNVTPAVKRPAKKRPGRARKPPRGRRGKRGRGLQKKASEAIDFLISERKFKDETLELEFFLHESDHEKFVYWMPGNPDEKFALKYTTESQYIRNPDNGLVPTDPKEEGEADDKKPSLILRPMDWEDVMERDYELIVGGKKSITGSSFDEDEDEDEDEDDDYDYDEDTGTCTGTGKSPVSARGKRAGPRKITADDKKQLRDTMKSMPPDAKRKMLDALKGSLK